MNRFSNYIESLTEGVLHESLSSDLSRFQFPQDLKDWWKKDIADKTWVGNNSSIIKCRPTEVVDLFLKLCRFDLRSDRDNFAGAIVTFGGIPVFYIIGDLVRVSSKGPKNEHFAAIRRMNGKIIRVDKINTFNQFVQSEPENIEVYEITRDNSRRDIKLKRKNLRVSNDPLTVNPIYRQVYRERDAQHLRKIRSPEYIKADEYFKDPKKAAEFISKNLGKEIVINNGIYKLLSNVSVERDSGDLFELRGDHRGEIRVYFRHDFATGRIIYDSVKVRKPGNFI